jgi:hypothetical protein
VSGDVLQILKISSSMKFTTLAKTWLKPSPMTHLAKFSKLPGTPMTRDRGGDSGSDTGIKIGEMVIGSRSLTNKNIKEVMKAMVARDGTATARRIK